MPDRAVLSTWYCECDVSSKDEVWLPLSFYAKSDGSYLVTCNARSFNCKITSVTLTTDNPNATITAAGGSTWIVGSVDRETVATVAVKTSCEYCGTKTTYNTITLPKSGSGYSLTTATTTVHHKLTAAIENAVGKQWQESSDGSTWSDIDGATGETLIIATGTGQTTSTDPDVVAFDAACAAIPAYEKYYRCQATNTAGTTTSNILHVIHTGAGNPTVTEV